MVVPTQNECAQIGVKFEGDWVLDRITGFRNVYPDLSWTYHPIPTPVYPVQVDRGGLNAALRRRLVEAGGRLLWNARVTDLEFRDDDGTAIAITAGPQAVLGAHADRRGRALRAVAARPESQVRGSGVLADRRRSLLQVVRRHSAEYVGPPSVRCARRDDQWLAVSPGLYRYILEADLAEKQSDRLGAIEFYESVARHHDRWLYQRVMRSRRWAGDGRWRRSDIASAPSRATVCCWWETPRSTSRR